MNIPSLSIIIPCFNEAQNVRLVLERFKDLLVSMPYTVEVIVVDGGSTDDTPHVLEQEFAQLNPQQFKLLLMPKRRGYGFDIMHALSHAQGDVLAWTHADMQTDPQDVLTGFSLFLAQQPANVVIKGKRKNRHWLEELFTRGMQWVVRAKLKVALDDINAQPKLFSKDFYQKFLVAKAPDDFSLDLYLLYMAKKNNYQIIDFPVYFAKRQFGEAKGGGSWKTRIKLIKRTFNYIAKLTNKTGSSNL